MKFNLQQLQSFYNREKNVTRATKLYCIANDIVYDDIIRRRASDVLAKVTPSGETRTSPAKVLIFDLETSYIWVRVFSLWQHNITPNDIVRDWILYCFSAKWLFEDGVISHCLTEEELKTRDDKRIVRELWKLLNEADIVIAHNAEKFDVGKSNAKFLEHDLKLPSPYQVIDTKKIAQKKFNLISNSLDYIAKYLGFEGKMETPKDMWKKVDDGDFEMLVKMDVYCQEDVLQLEKVYLTLRPYIQPHPNIGLFIQDDVQCCPSCGSTNIHWHKDKVYTTTVNQYAAFTCNDCHSWGRSRTGLFNAKNNKNLTTPNAR